MRVMTNINTFVLIFFCKGAVRYMCHHHRCFRRTEQVYLAFRSLLDQRDFPTNSWKMRGQHQHQMLRDSWGASSSFDKFTPRRAKPLNYMLNRKGGEEGDLQKRYPLQSGATGCGKGFVTCFLRVPQAARLNCSCHAAQASRGNFQKTCFKTFYWTCRPRLLSVAHPLVHDNLLNVFLEIPQAGGSMV